MTEKMELGIVYETKDYSIFKFIKGNRSLKEGSVGRLITSIQEKNLLQANPIIVNSKMEVVDGQTRLAAAKQLGIPIYYMVAPIAGLEDVRLLNINTTKWNLEDYLESYVLQTIPDYYTLKYFHEDYTISISICIQLLSGMGTRQHARATFKNGDFVVTSKSQAEAVAERLLDLREYADRGIWRSRDFIMAIVMLYREGNINHGRLMKSLKKSGHTIYRQGSIKDYLRRFAEEYALADEK